VSREARLKKQREASFQFKAPEARLNVAQGKRSKGTRRPGLRLPEKQSPERAA
jgi:hypothetical protein